MTNFEPRNLIHLCKDDGKKSLCDLKITEKWFLEYIHVKPVSCDRCNHQNKLIEENKKIMN